MKNFIAPLLFLLSFYGNTQTVSKVSYTSNSLTISNPERGFYRHLETQSTNYAALDQTILNSYKAENTTLILRLFYLKDFINAPISNAYLTNMQNDFNKIRNAGLKCVVRFAYTDQTTGILDATKTQILAHIAQIKPLLNANADIIAVVQAGFIGSWGEWSNSTHFGNNPTPTDFQNRKDVLDALLAALPSSRMVQVRTPSIKQNLYGTTTALTQSQAFSGTSIARTGEHNDCFLAAYNDEGTYINPTTEYPYLAQETKYTPMGGETCELDSPRSDCPTALTEMAEFHWSFMNLDYNTDVLNGFKRGGCFVDMQNKMGYRFELTTSEFPISASSGSTITAKFSVKNTGFATPFNQRNVYLVLRNSSTNQEYTVAMKTDPRFWAAGTEQAVAESITLPANIVSGTYKLFLNLPDPDSKLGIRPEYSIQMANQSTWESNTGYNNLLQTITINSNTTDKTPPVTPVLPDVKGECSATATVPTTTDAVSGTITGTTTNPLTYTTQGTFVIHWTFTDGSGNSTTANQNVIVRDITPPVTPTLANVTGQCAATATAPTTTDNCKGKITGTTTDPLTYSTQGSFIIHWTFSDGNGNSTTANQNVIVSQPAKPTGLACWQTATFSASRCQWVVTGTQPAKPWVFPGQKATFDTTLCKWVITRVQSTNRNQAKNSATSRFADTETDDDNPTLIDEKPLVYPNPVTDILTITNTSLISSIEIFNILGQHVLLSHPNAMTAEMDMSNLPAGIYLLQIQSKGKTTVIKVNKKL